MAVRSDSRAVSAPAFGFAVPAADDAPGASSARSGDSRLSLPTRALLVGLACYLSTEAVANNFPPLFVSPIWPTNSILLCALLAAPTRHWWAYALAGFFSSVHHNSHTGAPVSQIVIFLVADA